MSEIRLKSFLASNLASSTLWALSFSPLHSFIYIPLLSSPSLSLSLLSFLFSLRWERQKTPRLCTWHCTQHGERKQSSYIKIKKEAEFTRSIYERMFLRMVGDNVTGCVVWVSAQRPGWMVNLNTFFWLTCAWIDRLLRSVLVLFSDQAIDLHSRVTYSLCLRIICNWSSLNCDKKIHMD